jgi:uncharacterized membrane protein YccC
MFSQATKEAIKVGLAVSLAILCAFWLGWERSYWSALAVFVVAANDSYSHAIVKARNRLIGTCIGACLAIFLLSMFPQDRLWLTVGLSIVLVVCTFMDVHKRYGYIFRMSYIVCVLITCLGGFNNESTFAMVVLRSQETVLGIIIYSVVFRFIWPRTTQDKFFELFAIVEKKSREQLQTMIDNKLPAIEQRENDHRVQLNRLHELHEILYLSLSDSPS